MQRVMWKNKLVAAKALWYSSSGILHAAVSNKLYHEFQWKLYSSEEEVLNNINYYISPTAIFMLDKITGDIIREFSRVKDAQDSGYKINKKLKPYNTNAKLYDWVYKQNYVKQDKIKI